VYALSGDGRIALENQYPDLVAHHQQQVRAAESRASYKTGETTEPDKAAENGQAV
jgi:hypothetical protein